MVGEEGVAAGEVEFAVLVMGWVARAQAPEGTEAVAVGAGVGGGADTGVEGAPVAQGVSGEAVLGTEQFWGDLRGWLLLRVRDEGVAGEAAGAFRRAWDGRAEAR